MADDIVTLKLTLDKSDVDVKIKSVEQQIGDAGGKAGGAFTAGLKGALAGVAAALAGAFAVGKVVSAAKEQESAINAINSALVATGRYSEQASQSMQEFASSLQASSVYGDDAILRTSALIQSMRNLDTQGLQRATKSAADLASVLGTDIESASRAVGMALNGNAGALGRVGIKIDETILKSKDYNAILAEIEKRVGGSALRATQTFEGASKQMGNAFGDILDELGMFIVKNPIVIGAMNAMSTAFTGVANSLNRLIAEGGIKDVTFSFIDFANKVVSNVIPVFELVSNAILLSVSKIAGGLGKVLEFIPGMSDLSAQMKEISAGFDVDLLSFEGTEAAIAALDGMKVKYTELATTMEKTRRANQAMSDQIAANSYSLSEAITTEMNRISEAYISMAKNVQGAVEQGLTRAIAGGIQTMVTSLVKGENALKNFGAFMLTTLGDLAIQVGTMIIATSVAMMALFSSLNPAAGIVLGAALVAVGAALKAFGDKGSKASSGAISSGPAAQSTTQEQMDYTNPIARDTRPQSSVNLTIQGDVLDSDETSLRIVNLLNSAINDKGAQVSMA